MNRRDFLKCFGLGGLGMMATPELVCGKSIDVDALAPKKNIKPLSGSWFEFQHSAAEGGYWNDALKKFDLYGWISLMSQLIIINRALYVNKQQEGKICAIT